MWFLELPLYALPLVMVAAVLMLNFGLGYLVRRGLRRLFGAGSDRDDIAKTTLAKLGAGNLPGDASAIARIGTGGEAAFSLNTRIMKASLGLKLVAIVVGGLLQAYLWTDFQPEFWEETGISSTGYEDLIKATVAAIVVYSWFYIFFYEVRYDDYSIIAPNSFLRPREYVWKELSSIHDDGHYAYKLRFRDGRKLAMQKYVVGIRDFLSYAKARIEANSRG